MTVAGTTSPKRQRRTQEERSATTRAALLDATIDCLVEYGYANLTTTRVVERAGVSRGAQVHHFPTKAELVAEAVKHLANKRMQEFVEEAPRLPRSDERRVAWLLDRAWDVHASPLFVAALELWVAARTDVTQAVTSVAPTLFPKLAARQTFNAELEATMAAIRGLALLRFVDEPEEIERRWRAVKRRMLDLFRAELSAPLS
jgi:AcrR family transcriptional regulator